MVRTPLQGPAGGDRARKRAGRRARGLEIVERDGSWHVHGTIRAGGRSHRLRKSLGLPATAATYDLAWDEARALEVEIRDTAAGRTGRGAAVAVAVHAYLTRPRQRPLGASVIRILKEIAAQFGPRRLNDVTAADWRKWVDARQAGNSAGTRERFISGVAALLTFARKHHGLTVSIEFDRDKEARNPRRRRRRAVDELRPELIGLVMESAHISLRAQLATEWSTGARVSSVLYGVPVRNVLLAPGRETITFERTKNGDDVVAALHPAAAKILLEYARWRGNLHDREAPFFLTHRRRPYTDNGRASGGQNKTGFKAATRRARQALLDTAFKRARTLRRDGRRDQALAILLAARADCRLLRRLTQHWFRHLLATRMRRDMAAGMAQGGWRDERSFLGYVHDVPDARRALVAEFEAFDTPANSGTSLTRSTSEVG